MIMGDIEVSEDRSLHMGGGIASVADFLRDDTVLGVDVTIEYAEGFNLIDLIPRPPKPDDKIDLKLLFLQTDGRNVVQVNPDIDDLRGTRCRMCHG